ncbi:MAG: PspC domain-containing protein [Bacteroidia bacterium]
MARQQQRSAGDIASEIDMSYMYDDIESIRERESEEEKTQQSKLSLAGIMAILAGVGMAIAAFGNSIFGGSLDPGFLEFLVPLLTIVGFSSLAYGLYKTVKLAFRKKELNFPTLNVYRKRKPKTPEELARESMAKENARTRNRSRGRRQRADVRGTYAPTSGPKRLRRSLKQRVFTGLAGGVSEYVGISPWLVRFLFIMLTSATGGMFTFLYLFLSIAIAPDYDREFVERGGRNIHVQ